MPPIHFPTDSLFRRPKGDLMHLFLAGVGRKVAVNMLQLFSPVYVYLSITELEYSKSFALIAVFIYYALTFLIKLVTLIFAEDLSRDIGFKSVIRFSTIPYLLFIPVLILAGNAPFYLLLAACLWGFHAGLYWWGYHGYFVKSGEKEHLGESVGEANFLETAAVVVSPILGGFVTTFFGFPALFGLSSIFMVLSLILLGKGHEKRQKKDVSFFEILQLVKKHKYTSLTYISSAGESVLYLAVWPIFLYLFFEKAVSLGIVISIAALLAALFSSATGRWADSQGEGKIIKIGSPILFVSWLVRIIGNSVGGFIVADTLRNFGQRMIALPLNALSYRKAVEAETAKAILFFETTTIFGVIFALLTASFLALIWFDFSLIFILASLFSIFPLISVFKGTFKEREYEKE